MCNYIIIHIDKDTAFLLFEYLEKSMNTFNQECEPTFPILL